MFLSKLFSNKAIKTRINLFCQNSDMAELNFSLQKVLDESAAEVEAAVADMDSDFKGSNDDFDIDNEAAELATQDRNFNFEKQLVIPNFHKKSKKNESGSTSPSASFSQSIPEIKMLQDRPSLDLAQLFSAPIKAAEKAPIDSTTYQGKMNLLAQKERESKIKAKDLCINRISPITTHLENWQVSNFK